MPVLQLRQPRRRTVLHEVRHEVENRCPSCNTVNPADANFSRKCGRARESGAPDVSTSLRPAPKTSHIEFSQGRQTAEGLEGERKTVTALFAKTEFTGGRGEPMRRLIERRTTGR